MKIPENSPGPAGGIPELIAHRGYAALYPENTLPAMAAAIEAGARYLETDLQFSADQVPLLFHDRTLERQCGRPGEIKDYTLARLREFSAGLPERFGDRFAGVKIATLEELVRLLKRHPEVTAFFELKENSLEHFGLQRVIVPVLEGLHELRERAVIISYNINSIAEVSARGWPAVGVVVDSWSEIGNQNLVSLGPQYIFCDEGGLPPGGQVFFPGAEVAVFEVSDPGKAMRLAERGVAMIETFEFVKMKSALDRVAGHGRI